MYVRVARIPFADIARDLFLPAPEQLAAYLSQWDYGHEVEHDDAIVESLPADHVSDPIHIENAGTYWIRYVTSAEVYELYRDYASEQHNDT